MWMVSRRTAEGLNCRVTLLGVALSISLLQSGAWANPASDMIRIINAERAKRQLGPLQSEPDLVQAARDHNLYQYQLGKITHRGSKGRWPWDRAKRFGYSGKANENVGYSSIKGDSAQSLHEAFMSSSGHRANLLDRRWQHVGVHLCWGRRGTYVCVIFGG